MTDANRSQPPSAPDRTSDDLAYEEQSSVRGALDVALPEHLRAVRDRLEEVLPVEEVIGFRGELTVVVPPHALADALRTCRDDPGLACEFLSDLSWVHWPGGTVTTQREETTGWPRYEEEREGRIQLDYVLRSLGHGHVFRIRTSVPDVEPSVASATGTYGSAVVMEREAFDMVGVRFEGHHDLSRIFLPDEWEGHPHRKDYPLGGVEVEYQGATVPPPDERDY